MAAPAASPMLLFTDIDEPGLCTLEVYERRGGYESLRKALAMTPEEVLDQLKASGLRGRGGAGFAMFLSRSSKAASLSSQPSSRALFIKAPDIAVIVLCRHPLGWEPRSSTLAAASS